MIATHRRIARQPIVIATLGGVLLLGLVAWPGTPVPAPGLVSSGSAATPSPAGAAAPAASSVPDSTPPKASSAPPQGPNAVAALFAVRPKVDVNLLRNPSAAFISEQTKEWCAVAGTQMVLAMYGKADLSPAFQAALAGRIGEWETPADSLNGKWGPSAIVKALEAYGVRGYEVRTYRTRAAALRDAALAISSEHAPVLLMAWYGAHTWVMTGYEATADPTVYGDGTVTGTYILDPWYPRVSTIWGPSDPPGAFQDTAEMIRNYLPWRRPEGHYPGRDGRFIAIVPTRPLER